MKEKTPVEYGKNPYFTDGGELPELPDELIKLDRKASEKYREEMELWWAQTKENLMKMRDEILSLEVKQSEERSSQQINVVSGNLSNVEQQLLTMIQGIDTEVNTLKDNLENYLYNNILVHDLPSDKSWLDH